jgi:hypothetical protein
MALSTTVVTIPDMPWMTQAMTWKISTGGAVIQAPDLPDQQVDDLLTPAQVGQLVNVAEKTLANWRARKQGPPYTKLTEGRGGRVRYPRRSTLAWLDERRVAA